MSQSPTPTIEDYKKYTRELKLKIKRLQDKNKELVTENVGIKQGGGQADSGMSKIDFAVSLNKKVIRAQALWRGILARRNFKRLLARVSKGEAPKQTPNTNQFVMIRAKEAAERLGLTLEMLYRAADVSSQGNISLEEFKLFLRKVKLKLVPAQLTRFLFLVDEDCSGLIAKEDFYTTLAAYGVNTERSWAHDSSRTYDQQCLLKFARAVKQNNYSKEEVIRKCDPQGSGRIPVSVLSQFVDSDLRIEFKEREKFALTNYLDVNKTAIIDTNHLAKELDKAFNINIDEGDSQIILGVHDKRDFSSLPAVGENGASSKSMMRTDLYSTGEQGISGKGTLSQLGNKANQGAGKNNGAAESRSTQGRNPASSLSDNEADLIQAVVNKIQKVSPMGRFLLEILNICEIDDSGYISLDDLNRYVSTKYGNVLTIKDRTTLIKAMDTNKNHNLDLFELRNFFKAFSNKNATFLEFSLRILAKSLDKMMISTSDFLTKKKVDLTGRINFELFCTLMPDLIKIDDRECAALFKEIDSKDEGSVTPRQLVEVVNGYRTESFKEFFSASSKLEKKQKDRVDMTREGRDFQEILAKIVNSKKTDLKGFFRLLIDSCSESERGIPIDIVKETADLAFVDILNERERHIFKDSLDINDNGSLEPEEMLDTLKSAMQDPHDRIQMHFYYRACVLDKRQVATEDYFYPFNLYKKTEYTESEFIPPAMRSLNFSREEAIFCFEVLADKAKTIIGYDIIDCVESFRKFKNLEAKCGEPPQKFPPKKPTPMPIGGTKKPEPMPVEPLDPKDRDETIKIVKEALAAKKLSPLHVFRLADEDETNSISAITLKQTLQSLVPDIPPKISFKLMKILDTNRNGFIDLKEYEIVFLKDQKDLEDIKDNDSRQDYRRSEHQSISNESRIENNDSVMDEIKTPRNLESRTDVQSDDPAQLTKNIGKVMEEYSIKPEAVFEAADLDNAGSIPVMTLLKTMREFMPDIDTLSLFRASKYMDSSMDGFVKKKDFLAALSGKKIESAPRAEEIKKPARTSAPSLAKPVEKPPTQNKPQASETKSWEQPPLLSDREFYQKIRNLKHHLITDGVSVDSLFGFDDLKEEPVMAVANRIHESVPTIPKKDIVQILKFVDVSNNGTILRDEFELMIGYDSKKAEIEDSQMFDEKRIDKEAIDKIVKLLKGKNKDATKLFEHCDLDKNGLANILDIKIGLENLFDTQPNLFPSIIAFVRELKFIFKTDNFDKLRFAYFMNDPVSSYVHQGYDIVRRSIEAMLKTPGQLNDATSKLKKLVQLGPSKDLSLNVAAEKFDSDKDGVLSIQEFTNFVTSLKDTGINGEQISYLSNLADKDHDGRIKIDDFIEFLRADKMLDDLLKKSG